MKYKNKFTLGMLASLIVVVPITTVISCGNNKNHNMGIAGANNTPIVDSLVFDTSKMSKTPYSIDSLKADALKINNNKEWTSGFWKNSLQCESMAQAINFLIAWAQQEGMTVNNSLKDQNKYVITDDIAKMSDNDALIALGLDKDNQDVKESMSVFSELKQIVAKTGVPTENDVAIASLRAGDQKLRSTYDLDTTYTTMNQQGLDQLKLKYPIGTSTKYHMTSWYNTMDNTKTQITTFEEDTFGLIPAVTTVPISLIREVAVPGLANSYPIITDENILKDDIAPYIQMAVYDFLKGGINFIKFLPTPIHAAIDFLTNKFKTTDSDGTIHFNAKAITDSNFFEALKNINKSGNVNLLAIKALYLGYDDSFATQDMTPWWPSSVDKATQVVTPLTSFAGLAQQEDNLSTALVDLVTRWVTRVSGQAAQMGFNPSKNVQENRATYKL